MTYHNRYECKFVVSETIALRVLQRVAPWVQPDPHAAKRANHTYTIASLYLDDAEHTLGRSTVEGRFERNKLRIRSYGDGPLFLEVKSRRDRVVRKSRCPVPANALPMILSGKPFPVPNLSPQKERSMQEFLQLLALHRAIPTATVRYDRQAYVGRDDDQLRVTFDRRLAAMPESSPRVRMQGPGYVSIHAGGVVLELKFTDRCPPWMFDTIRELDLTRRSFSKYAKALDALTLAERSES